MRSFFFFPASVFFVVGTFATEDRPALTASVFLAASSFSDDVVGDDTDDAGTCSYSTSNIIREFPSFFSGNEIRDFVQRGCSNHGDWNIDGSRFVRAPLLASRLLRRHRHEYMAYTTATAAAETNSDFPQIRYKTITKTTSPHQDRRVTKEGAPVVPGEVGFVFLNSNPHATFVHGDVDDPQSQKTTVVPVEEGKLVVFPGSVPHHTVVESGAVKLAGPFLLSTLEPVGSVGVESNLGPPYTATCNRGSNTTISLYAYGYPSYNATWTSDCPGAGFSPDTDQDGGEPTKLTVVQDGTTSCNVTLTAEPFLFNEFSVFPGDISSSPVTFNDTVNPTFPSGCPDLTVEAGVDPTPLFPAAEDTCDPSPQRTCNPNTVSSFPPNSTTSVTCTVTDSSGNSATCTFNVIVKATSVPVPRAAPTCSKRFEPCGSAEGALPCCGENFCDKNKCKRTKCKKKCETRLGRRKCVTVCRKSKGCKEKCTKRIGWKALKEKGKRFRMCVIICIPGKNA